jgi:hypothetical protein
MPLFRPRRVGEEARLRTEELGRTAWLVRTGGFRHSLPNRWMLVGGGLAAGTLLRSFFTPQHREPE